MPKTRSGRRLPLDLKKLPGAVRRPLPARWQPQLAETAASPPTGEKWLHEIKFDGYRLLAWCDRGKITLRTRSGLDWTERVPHLACALRELPLQSALFDGELVALLPSGISSFADLQASFGEGASDRLLFYAFDLVHLDGYDLSGVPLLNRKGILAQFVDPNEGVIRYTDHLVGHGPEFFDQCRKMGLEGIISKRVDRPYRSGRSPDWLKSKCVLRDEFVIGGYTLPKGSRRGLGAVLVGFFDADGAFVYAGKVGTGFDERTLASLSARLEELRQFDNPFGRMPADRIERGIRWVSPVLVAQIEYSHWTASQILRTPSFRGLREDVPASSVVRAAPVDELKAGRRTGATRVSPVGPLSGGVLAAETLAELESVRLTNPQKRLYPQAGLTKFDLVAYYVEIADWILPHLAGRPVSLVRCPDGVDGQRFFQRHATAGMPEEVRRVPLPDGEEYLAIDGLAGLISLVQMSVLEFHPWNCRTDRIERPDRVVFDLDPGPDVSWSRVIEAAQGLQQLLQELKLAGFVKTTGGKGLHVLVPIERRQTWEEVKAFGEAAARALTRRMPGQFTLSAAQRERQGRIYIDCPRNTRGATIVCAYSTRANPQAPVSVPLAWSELSPHLGSDHFTVRNLRRRLASLERDPWEGYQQVRQRLTAATFHRLGGAAGNRGA